MSIDISTFHSSEMDDPSLLPGEGWYIGAFRDTACYEALGPFSTQEVAIDAMTHGAWLYMFQVGGAGEPGTIRPAEQGG